MMYPGTQRMAVAYLERGKLLLRFLRHNLRTTTMKQQFLNELRVQQKRTSSIVGYAQIDDIEAGVAKLEVDTGQQDAGVHRRITSTTQVYTYSLPDALPPCPRRP